MRKIKYRQRKYMIKAQIRTKIRNKNQINYVFRKSIIEMAKNPESQIDTSQQVSRTRKLKKTLPKYILTKMFTLNNN